MIREINRFINTNGLVHRGVILFSHKDSIDFIKLTMQYNSVRILGIDAFNIIDKRLQPDMSKSTDYSAIKNNDVTKEKALIYFSNSSKEMYYEIVFV